MMLISNSLHLIPVVLLGALLTTQRPSIITALCDRVGCDLFSLRNPRSSAEERRKAR